MRTAIIAASVPWIRKSIESRPVEGTVVNRDSGKYRDADEVALDNGEAGVVGGAGNGAQETGRTDPSTTALSTAHAGDRAADSGSGAWKVSRIRLSKLQKLILVRAANGGVERADVVAEFFKLGRRYRGHHDEACLSHRKEREHQERYRRAQPTVTRALKRLEARGLAQLIRTSGGYIKKIELSIEGQALATVIAADLPHTAIGPEKHLR